MLKFHLDVYGMLSSYHIVMSRWPLLQAWWFLEVFSPNNMHVFCKIHL